MFDVVVRTCHWQVIGGCVELVHALWALVCVSVCAQLMEKKEKRKSQDVWKVWSGECQLTTQPLNLTQLER